MAAGQWDQSARSFFETGNRLGWQPIKIFESATSYGVHRPLRENSFFFRWSVAI